MRSIYQILAIVLVVYFIFEISPYVRKSIGSSFVNTRDKNFIEVVFKGETLIKINKNKCSVIQIFDEMKNDLEVKNDFNNKLTITKDLSYVKYESDDIIKIWKNGRFFSIIKPI